VSLVELLLVLGLMGVIAAMSVPALLTGLDEARGIGAARYLASRVRWARTQAALRSAAVGIRFESGVAGWRFTVYSDGDRDGIGTSDVRRGIDPVLVPAERLDQRFPGVGIGIRAGTPRLDGGAALGADPVRLGRTDTLSVSPAGSSTSGTVFLHTRRGRQFAVRVLGATGRARVWWLHPTTGRWAMR